MSEVIDYYAQAALEMVENQLIPGGIHNTKILESMKATPRHLFVPSFLSQQAYDDTALPIGYNQTISQPYIVAFMLQTAQLKPTDIVLEIDTGSGYAAAVLSKLVKKVYTIEFIPELASEAQNRLRNLGYSNVIVLQGDGSTGLKEHAPFDAILVTAGAPIIPESLKKQLAINGRLVIPVGDQLVQQLICITRLDQNHFQEEKLGSVQFVPLKGKKGWSTR